MEIEKYQDILADIFTNTLKEIGKTCSLVIVNSVKMSDIV